MLLVERPDNSSSKESTSNNNGLPPVPRVHLLPNSPAAFKVINEISSSLFFWLQSVDQAAQAKQHSSEANGDDDDSGAMATFRGYSIEPGASGIASSTEGDQAVGGGGDVLPVVPAWQVVLPGRVLGVAAKDPAEPVHSYVKVGGGGVNFE